MWQKIYGLFIFVLISILFGYFFGGASTPDKAFHLEKAVKIALATIVFVMQLRLAIPASFSFLLFVSIRFSLSALSIPYRFT
jgi:hypothetical protein